MEFLHKILHHQTCFSSSSFRKQLLAIRLFLSSELPGREGEDRRHLGKKFKLVPNTLKTSLEKHPKKGKRMGLEKGGNFQVKICALQMSVQQIICSRKEICRVQRWKNVQTHLCYFSPLLCLAVLGGVRANWIKHCTVL